MTMDNWHKRFGKMWVAILIILAGLAFEVQWRTDEQSRLRDIINEQKIDIIHLKENIYQNNTIYIKNLKTIEEGLKIDIHQLNKDIMPSCLKSDQKRNHK